MEQPTEQRAEKRGADSGAAHGSVARVIPCGPKIPCRVTTENGEELMMMQPTIILHDIAVELPPNAPHEPPPTGDSREPNTL